MPTTRLTQIVAERVKPPAAGRLELFDTHLPGFGLRISETGAKSWILFYRVGGKQRRYTIGTFAAFPKVDQARERARELLRDVARGIDPAAEKAAAVPARAPDTVGMLVTDFIERYAKARNRSWRETERLLARHVVDRWGDCEAQSIRRRDILEALDELVEQKGPIAANRTLAAVRKMFNWAVERDILPVSPASDIKAPGKEIERERVLTDAELAAIWSAAEHMGVMAAGFFRVLLLTGQRRNEVATMRWADLDLTANVWRLPRAATKGDRSHEVPLAPLAVEAIVAVPRIGEFVFSTRRGDKPISGFSKLKDRITKLAAIEADWRLHDLRRTAGTGMASLGIAVGTISRVLNHKEGGVTRIYNRYGYLDEKRHALETWGRKVEGLVRPVPSNVVDLRA